MPPASFLDKLAPELRVCIYEHVFGPQKTIKLKNSFASLGIFCDTLDQSGHEHGERTTETLIECSILATNKFIFQEAIQVFYHNKTIRATFPELKQLLWHECFPTHVESIEIADCANHDEWSDLSICPDILKRLQRLPRIATLGHRVSRGKCSIVPLQFGQTSIDPTT